MSTYVTASNPPGDFRDAARAKPGKRRRKEKRASDLGIPTPNAARRGTPSFCHQSLALNGENFLPLATCEAKRAATTISSTTNTATERREITARCPHQASHRGGSASATWASSHSSIARGKRKFYRWSRSTDEKFEKLRKIVGLSCLLNNSGFLLSRTRLQVTLAICDCLGLHLEA